MHLNIVDESRDNATPLSSLWRLLVAGQVFIETTYCDTGRCFGIVTRRAGAPVRAVSADILERVFESDSQKAIAYERGLSFATVATHAATALDSMCTKLPVSRAPVILVMAALAARGLPLGSARLDERCGDGRWLLSVEVPGKSLRDRLSESEHHVAMLAIEGASHAQIARTRASSLRTVANQLGSVFQKLGTSGRSALRNQAIQEYSVQQARRAAAPKLQINTLGSSEPRGLDARWESPRAARAKLRGLPVACAVARSYDAS